jgi:hypothetical protein
MIKPMLAIKFFMSNYWWSNVAAACRFELKKGGKHEALMGNT